jgi:hypothetical protein
VRLALFVATLVATVMVTYFGGVASGSGASSQPRCIAGAAVARPYGLEAAAERAVPAQYANLSAQGSVGWKQFGVVGVVNLALYEERGESDVWPVDVAHAWRAVARKCGAKVADRAWAVFVSFPNCQIPCSHGTLYFARSRGAWRLLWVV